MSEAIDVTKRQLTFDEDEYGYLFKMLDGVGVHVTGLEKQTDYLKLEIKSVAVRTADGGATVILTHLDVLGLWNIARIAHAMNLLQTIYPGTQYHTMRLAEVFIEMFKGDIIAD